jgi:hypothetical protein
MRGGKATGLANLPCHGFHANAAWLEIILAATDLVAWAKLIGFADQPEIARCEIATFRYRVPHVAARITRGARQLRLRIDATWRWAITITTAWHRVRAAFPSPADRPVPTHHETTKALESPPNPATRGRSSTPHPEKTEHTGQPEADRRPKPTGMQNRG